MYSIRTATESDAPLLRHLAKNCPPLDVHTQYTYWAIAKFFGNGCFILETDSETIGYIMTLDTPHTVFIWQIGIIESHRGKNLSQLLIQKVYEYASYNSKNIEVTISEYNTISKSAFQKFCSEHGISLKNIGIADIIDIDDEAFKETEIHYQLI